MVSRSTRRKAQDYAATHGTNYTTALRAVTNEIHHRSTKNTLRLELGHTNNDQSFHINLDRHNRSHLVGFKINHAQTQRFIWSTSEQAATQGYAVSYYPHLGSENDEVFLAQLNAKAHQISEHVDGSISVPNFPHGEILDEITTRYRWLQEHPNTNNLFDKDSATDTEPQFRPKLIIAETSQTYSQEFSEVATLGRSVGIHLILLLDNPLLLKPEDRGNFTTTIMLINPRTSGKEITSFTDHWGSALGAKPTPEQTKRWNERASTYKSWSQVFEEQPTSENQQHHEKQQRFTLLVKTPHQTTLHEIIES